MVSINSNISNKYNVHFSGNKESQHNAQAQNGGYADTIVLSNEKELKKMREGTVTQKYFGTPSGNIPFGLAMLFDGYGFYKILSKNTSKKQRSKLTNMMILVTALSYPVSYFINKHVKSKYDEKYDNLKNKFNELNKDTNAKLADNSIYTGVMAMGYMPASGKIIVSKNILDPLSKKPDKLLKHELVHARQYETVARSKDGIKKINYVVAKKLANSLNAPTKTEINTIYQDIIKNKDSYNNKKLNAFAGTYEVDLVDYITALNTLISNPRAGINDIPMIINTNHYQEVIDKKGALTPEEEKKADEYYKAMIDYKPISFFSALNPWSSYYQNPLEKEAYKENPTLITKLAYMFDKKS